MSEEIEELKSRIDELESEIQTVKNEADGHGFSKVRIRLLAEAVAVLMAEPTISEAARKKIGDCLDQF